MGLVVDTPSKPRHSLEKNSHGDAESLPSPDMTAGDVLVDCLLEWDVDTVFGLPGDGVNGIIEAFRTRQSKIRFIQVRQ
jgi:hypothetical protein